jgi:hypothetical protein
MNGRYLPFGSPSNPLAQIGSLVLLGVLLVGAVIMGAFVLMVILGLGLLGFLAFTLQSWWLRRKAGGRGGNAGPGSGRGSTSVRYIEGEYEVVERHADAERRRREQR